MAAPVPDNSEDKPVGSLVAKTIAFLKWALIILLTMVMVPVVILIVPFMVLDWLGIDEDYAFIPMLLLGLWALYDDEKETINSKIVFAKDFVKYLAVYYESKITNSDYKFYNLGLSSSETKKVKLVATVFPVIFLGFGYYYLYTPKNYDDCILESMRGVSDRAAAIAIRNACESKFPSTQ